MSRLTDLIDQTRHHDPTLAAELEREYHALAGRRAFGLNFERHQPEAVELPNRPVRRGDKVRVLPARGSADRGDQRLWSVRRIEKRDGGRWAHLDPIGAGGDEAESTMAATDDVVVVAEFKDPIYPGLVLTEKIEAGGEKPFHTVINAENFHALKALTFTHSGKVDAIYIDPPYNTGAKDWRYNNDYVEADDLYRHSKWLAFMERRLKLARELLDPDDSVLIVTIDEKEYLRLGLLLEQTFPDGQMQMVSSVINPAGAGRSSEFARTDEYIYFLRFGASRVAPEQRDEELRPVTWDTLRRSDITSVRPTRPGQFYPIYVNRQTATIEHIGEPLAHGVPRDDAPQRAGCDAVFPIRPDGTEMNWGITAGPARDRWARGYLRVGRHKPDEPQTYVISYLTSGIIADIDSGAIEVTGRAGDGSVKAHYVEGRVVMPTTSWSRPAHDAQRGGTAVLRAMLPDRRFPFPKSLYAVEDALRHFVAGKPDAIVVDFFAGSGTTAHAVMRLNHRDGGRRQCILVTNNEVSAGEHADLRRAGLRPGDGEWEQRGICDHITKPRIKAAITGEASDGDAVAGDYRFGQEFPMAQGLAENAAFFTLSYESPVTVGHNRAFAQVAPLLWMRAGSRGRIISSVAERGWDVAESHGVLFDLDCETPFLVAVAGVSRLRIAFIVSNDDRRFQEVARKLPETVEAVRLYESYLTHFQFTSEV